MDGIIESSETPIIMNNVFLCGYQCQLITLAGSPSLTCVKVTSRNLILNSPNMMY